MSVQTPPLSATQGAGLDKRALPLAVTAMLCGGVLLHLYLNELEARATGGSKVAVVVAAEDSAAGTALTRSMVGVRSVPQAYVESRHIRAVDADKLMGMRLRAPMRAGEALLWSDIAGTTEQARGLSSLVRAGMRAWIVRAEQSALSDFVEPGDRVDVLLVSISNATESSTTRARTLLEGVLVLAVNGRTDGTEQPSVRSSASTGVALAVTRDQGLVLASSERSGSLRLLLRNPDDVPVDAASPQVGDAQPLPTVPSSGVAR